MYIIQIMTVLSDIMSDKKFTILDGIDGSKNTYGSPIIVFVLFHLHVLILINIVCNISLRLFVSHLYF